MAGAFYAKLSGMGELRRTLKQLPILMEESARKSSERAMRIIHQQAVANAKEIDREHTPEKIYRNIVLRVAKRRKKTVLVRVGVAGGAQERGGGDTWYWRLVEFGHKTPGGGHFRGHHFMLRAFSSKVGRVSDAMRTYMNEEIDRFSK